MKQQNKIGFNNFKSFGERVQTFSQKPLTLIYGPNSIGKSSLLHFMLYAEYIKNTGNVDLEKTDFAGDSIDLGGFANFIHKRNSDAQISYHLTFNKEADIDKYFSPLYTLVKNFEKQGGFAHEIEVNDIKERIQAYRKKENDSFILYSPMRKKAKWVSDNPCFTQTQKNELKETALLRFEVINLYNFSVSPELSESEKEQRDQAYQACLESCELFENMVERNDGLQFDGLDMLLLYIIDYKELTIFTSQQTLDKTAQAVWGIYRLFSRIKDIKKLKIEFEFGRDNKKGNYNYRYFIDNELIYTFSSKDRHLELNNSCQVLVIFKESGFFKFTKPESDLDKLKIQQCNYILEAMDILGPTESTEMFSQIESFIGCDHCFFCVGGDSYSSLGAAIHYQAVGAIKTKANSRSSQYLGPIRFFPERFDLSEKDADGSETAVTGLSNRKTLEVKDFLMSVKLGRLLPQQLRGITTKLFFLIKMNKKVLFNSTRLVDSFNFWRGKKDKISSNTSMNSEKMWSRFIRSASLQDSVNKWLSDVSKLKIPYKIQTATFDKKNSIFRKLFRLKPIAYKILRFVDTRNDTLVTPREMGLGVSQVLPILIATHSLENHNIFIEQPELHLHPAFQCELADEIIRSMNTKNNEFVIESHSEHLLLRIMKRMRQTSEGILVKNDELALTPDDICLLYVDHNGEMTHVNELELDEDGSLLDPWPHGFFEEGFKERFA